MSHLPVWQIYEQPELCDVVLEQLLAIEPGQATIGIDGEDKNIQTRDTKVRFAHEGYWVQDIFKKLATQANEVWEYHLTGSERIQLAEYEVDQHYTWHTDTFTLSGAPVDRKITVVMLLNDAFEGGQFQVRLYNEYTAPMKKGSIIVFPSILEHRVLPVTSGVRYSATMWFNGPRFR